MCSPFVQLLGAVALFATLALGVMHFQQRPQPIVVVVPPAPVVTPAASTTTHVVYPYYCYAPAWYSVRTKWAYVPYCGD